MAKAKKRPPEWIDEQLRHAIKTADVSRYAIARATGVSEAVLSRFMSEDGGARRDLRLATAAKIAAHLGLELRPMGARK